MDSITTSYAPRELFPAMESITSATPGSTGEMTGVPKETGSADGCIDLTTHLPGFAGHTRTVTFSGTTWLNNLTIAGVADANCWASFAWEFPMLWMNVRDRNEFYQSFQYWKPISCSIEFANAQNYQQITTGTTPFMIPTTNGKIVMIRDDNYFINTQTAWPFNALSNYAYQTPPGNIAGISSLLQSFNQGGYSGDVTQFLPNYTIGYNDGSSAYTPGSYTTDVINEGIGNAKWLRIGMGHKINEHWTYHNHWWRSTQEFVTNQSPSIPFTNSSSIFRADEQLGIIRMSGTAASVSNTSKFLVAPGLTDNGSVTIGAVQSSSPTVQTGLAGQSAYGQIWTDPAPQPVLLLHLVPDIGVQGATGTCSCQVDFKITYKIALSGPLPTNLSSSATALTTNTSQPPNYRPLFLPVNKNFID